MSDQVTISILLATRGRTESLDRSIHTLMNQAEHPESVQLLFAFDNDDTVGLNHWAQVLKPWLDARNFNYKMLKFPRMGYINLHHYNNKMAKHALGRWFMIWNDDAVMETQNWDTEILRYDNQFKLLAVRTHRDHPYSIFPIVPRKWYDILGYISPHPTQDGWVSQQAYMLDILERIPVHVKHDRFDLTGNNQDATFKERSMAEGNPNNPSDFHHISQQTIRTQDCAKLAQYMRDELGLDISFFENIFKGTQDPWEKLKLNDTNGQMVQFKNPHAHFARTKQQIADELTNKSVQSSAVNRA